MLSELCTVKKKNFFFETGHQEPKRLRQENYHELGASLD